MTSKLALARKWLRSKTSLKRAQELEARRRSDLVAACFPMVDGKPHLFRGVNTVELEDGYKLKATTKAEAKVTSVEALQKAVAKLQDLGETGRLLAQRLVRWEPVVSLREFEKLDANQRRLFKKATEVKLSGPSVELVDP